jgi:hypothetical protein
MPFALAASRDCELPDDNRMKSFVAGVKSGVVGRLFDYLIEGGIEIDRSVDLTFDRDR